MENEATQNLNDGGTSFKETKVLSFGEILVGIEFKPSNDQAVTKIKSLMAEVANIMLAEYDKAGKSPVKSLLFDHAVGEIVSAQMAAVKVVTFKN